MIGTWREQIFSFFVFWILRLNGYKSDLALETELAGRREVIAISGDPLFFLACATPKVLHREHLARATCL